MNNENNNWVNICTDRIDSINKQFKKSDKDAIAVLKSDSPEELGYPKGYVDTILETINKYSSEKDYINRVVNWMRYLSGEKASAIWGKNVDVEER